MTEHIPSLAHIVAFVMKRGRKRSGVVRGHRRQVDAPREERGFSYFYARMITAVISFVNSGMNNGALIEAVETAHLRQRRSYAAAAAGLEPALRQLEPMTAARVNTSSTYFAPDGTELLLVRAHLRVTLRDGSVGQVYIHFSDDAPTHETVAVILHVLGRCFPTSDTLVLDARRGVVYRSGDVAHESDAEVLLLEELDQYAMLWEAA